MVWNRWRGFDKTWVNPAEMRAYGERCPSLAAVANWAGRPRRTSPATARRCAWASATISANGFAVLGARPLLGRGFSPEEDRAGGPEGGGARPRALAGPLRRRPRRDRAARRARRRAARGGGRDAARASRCPRTSPRTRPSRRRSTCPARPTQTTSRSSATTATTAAARLAPGASRGARDRGAARGDAPADRRGRYDPRAEHSAFAVPLPDEILGPHRPRGRGRPRRRRSCCC